MPYDIGKSNFPVNRKPFYFIFVENKNGHKMK